MEPFWSCHWIFIHLCLHEMFCVLEMFDPEHWFTRSRENLCRQYDIYLACAICSKFILFSCISLLDLSFISFALFKVVFKKSPFLHTLLAFLKWLLLSLNIIWKWKLLMKTQFQKFCGPIVWLPELFVGSRVASKGKETIMENTFAKTPFHCIVENWHRAFTTTVRI